MGIPGNLPWEEDVTQCYKVLDTYLVNVAQVILELPTDKVKDLATLAQIKIWMDSNVFPNLSTEREGHLFDVRYQEHIPWNDRYDRRIFMDWWPSYLPTSH